jgi:hypothetical protein
MAVVVSMVMSMVMAVVVPVIVSVVVTMSVVVPVIVSVVVSVVVAMVVTAALLTSKMVVTLAGVENLHLDEVEDEGHDGNHKHFATDDLGRLEETISGLDEKPDSHDPDGGHGDHSADDLSTVPAVCQMIVGTLLAESQGKDRHSEANNVRGQVSGVGHDGNGTGPISTDQLSANKQARDSSRDAEFFHSFALLFFLLCKALLEVDGRLDGHGCTISIVLSFQKLFPMLTVVFDFVNTSTCVRHAC